MVAREGFVYTETTVRHTKCGRMRGMVVGEGGRSSGILLYIAGCMHVTHCDKRQLWVKLLKLLVGVKISSENCQ